MTNTHKTILKIVVAGAILLFVTFCSWTAGVRGGAEAMSDALTKQGASQPEPEVKDISEWMREDMKNERAQQAHRDKRLFEITNETMNQAEQEKNKRW